MLRRWFLDHPRSVGESYFGHQRAAFGFAFRLFGAACACFVHGLIPKLFERTGSRTVTALHDDMVVHRTANTAESAAHPPAGEWTRPRAETLRRKLIAVSFAAVGSRPRRTDSRL